MPKMIVNGELVLYGPVGLYDFWDDNGFTSSNVIEALEQMEGDIVVRLNSGGGIAMEGSAIYNALKRHDGKVTVKIDGIAASAASVVAMAGDEIEMPHGTLMMIHEPSGVTLGPADEHRRTAAVLDTMTGVFAALYAARSSLSDEEVREMMKAETWLSPDDAVAKGFATSATEVEAPASADLTFDYRTYMRAPDHLVAQARNRQAERLPMVAVASAPHRKETTMPKQQNQPADSNAPATPATAPAATPQEPTAAAPPAASTNAADTVMQIYALCTTAKMTLAEANKIVAESGGEMGKAQLLVINHLADKDPDNGRVNPVATVTADVRDRFKLGAEKALLLKSGLPGGEANEFSSMSLRELAREYLIMAGVKKEMLGDAMKMVGMALGMRGFTMAGATHSTSDFPEILGNVANKSLLKGYDEAEETFQQWTSRGSLTDFRPTARVDLNLFSNLEPVLEGAEYTYGTIGERAELVQLITYGKMFSITRQAIINDDMDMFTRIPTRMGRAARRTVASVVWAILTTNPALSDGVALFHADHNNLATGALTTANLDAARAQMAKQKDPDEIAEGGLNIRPKFLLVPPELEGRARQLIASEFEVTATGTNNTRAPNYVRNAAEVISDARLSASSTVQWYLAADPGMVDTIEVSYLDGNDRPTLEQREGWNVDGVEFKVRLDFSAKPLDYRGLLRSSGA